MRQAGAVERQWGVQDTDGSRAYTALEPRARPEERRLFYEAHSASNFRACCLMRFADCRRHFVAPAVFSLLINILYLAPTLYMLQVYDRVVPTAGKTTLLFVTLALAMALMTLSALDMVHNRLLVRASERIDALVAPRILKQMMATNSGAAWSGDARFRQYPHSHGDAGDCRHFRPAVDASVSACLVHAALLARPGPGAKEVRRLPNHSRPRWRGSGRGRRSGRAPQPSGRWSPIPCVIARRPLFHTCPTQRP